MFICSEYETVNVVCLRSEPVPNVFVLFRLVNKKSYNPKRNSVWFIRF